MSTLLAVGRLANVSLLVCTCYVDKVLVKNKTKKTMLVKRLNVTLN